jgi:hypothetical protein
MIKCGGGGGDDDDVDDDNACMLPSRNVEYCFPSMERKHIS